MLESLPALANRLDLSVGIKSGVQLQNTANTISRRVSSAEPPSPSTAGAAPLAFTGFPSGTAFDLLTLSQNKTLSPFIQVYLDLRFKIASW
jgi:hypothetical protein